MLPVATSCGWVFGDVAQFAVLELPRNFGLEQVVGPGRAAAQMPFRRLSHARAQRLQQRFGLGGDLLPMLHGTGAVIGDFDLSSASLPAAKVFDGDKFGDVARQRRNLGRASAARSRS